MLAAIRPWRDARQRRRLAVLHPRVRPYASVETCYNSSQSSNVAVELLLGLTGDSPKLWSLPDRRAPGGTIDYDPGLADASRARPPLHAPPCVPSDLASPCLLTSGVRGVSTDAFVCNFGVFLVLDPG